jgi:hypothetical protein
MHNPFTISSWKHENLKLLTHNSHELLMKVHSFWVPKTTTYLNHAKKVPKP